MEYRYIAERGCEYRSVCRCGWTTEWTENQQALHALGAHADIMSDCPIIDRHAADALASAVGQPCNGNAEN